MTPKIATIVHEFLSAQKVANICLIMEDGNPYCFSCYYAWDEEQACFVFKSSPDSAHFKPMQQGKLAGTVLPLKHDPLSIQGIQFTGKIEPLLSKQNQFKELYYKRFPFARVIPGDVFVLEADFLKFTNNKMGFGNKTTWNR